jgi:hypothetical protein
VGELRTPWRATCSHLDIQIQIPSQHDGCWFEPKDGVMTRGSLGLPMPKNSRILDFVTGGGRRGGEVTEPERKRTT